MSFLWVGCALPVIEQVCEGWIPAMGFVGGSGEGGLKNFHLAFWPAGKYFQGLTGGYGARRVKGKANPNQKDNTMNITKSDARSFIEHHEDVHGTPASAWRNGVDPEIASQYLNGYDEGTNANHIASDEEIHALSTAVAKAVNA